MLISAMMPIMSIYWLPHGQHGHGINLWQWLVMHNVYYRATHVHIDQNALAQLLQDENLSNLTSITIESPAAENPAVKNPAASDLPHLPDATTETVIHMMPT